VCTDFILDLYSGGGGGGGDGGGGGLNGLQGVGTLSGAVGNTIIGGVGINNCGSGTLGHEGDVSCSYGSAGRGGGGVGASNGWTLIPGDI